MFSPVAIGEDKITFDKAVIRERLGQIISSLDGEELVKAYFILQKEFRDSSQNAKNLHPLPTKTSCPAIKDFDFKTLYSDYASYLKAAGKADLTIEKYTGEAARLGGYLQKKKMGIKELDFEKMIGYLNYARTKRGLKPASYSKVVLSVKLFLRYLGQNKGMDFGFAQRIKTPKTPKKEMQFLTAEEIKKIDQHLEGRKKRYRHENLRDRIIFYLGIHCGLRKSEMLKLEWKDIDFSQNKISIKEAKGGKERKVYYSSNLKNLLDGYRKKTRNYKGPVLRGSFGGILKASPLQDIIKRLYKGAGVARDGLTLHSLRHSYAVLLKNRGTDVHTIKELMGHGSLETTDKYLHCLGLDLEAAAL